MALDDQDRSAGLGRTRLFHPWAHEPEGGWSGACVSVSHVVGHRQGSGFDGLGWVTLGPVRARQGPVWVRISVVHQYGTVERSVRARRGLSGHIGFGRGSVWVLISIVLGSTSIRVSRAIPQGSSGPVGPPEGPVWVRTSIVHRYGTVERSVEPRRVLSCEIRVPTETRRNPSLEIMSTNHPHERC